MTQEQDYIGDGLYAMFDGWQIILRAPRDGGGHWVALEPETYTNLVRFAERINIKYGINRFTARREAGPPRVAELEGQLDKLKTENAQLREACEGLKRDD